MPPPDPELARWFNDEARPHEPMLRAWLRSRFPDEADVDDLVQESMVRILRARETQEIASPKAFLFATARNLAVERLRKQVRHATLSLGDLDELGVLDDGKDVAMAVERSEELEFLTQAIQSLPDRCRQIITLRKIYGMSQKDIARELGISENTVVNQGTIGMRKLADFFDRVVGFRHRHRE
jgi:RNA polymerase sigma factor (sigma-70 family)